MVNLLGTGNGTALYGAGFIDVTVKKWGYIIFAIFIIICGIKAVIKTRREEYRKACYNILHIPIYLVILFVMVFLTDIVYVKRNDLDKQKEYIKDNIKFTKQAYNINIEEVEIESTGTITSDDIANNLEVIQNINIYNKDRVLSHLEEYQTSLGYYTFDSTRSWSI